MKGLFAKRNNNNNNAGTSGGGSGGNTGKNGDLIKDDDMDGFDNSSTSSADDVESSEQQHQQQQAPQKSAVMSMFKKGLTAGKHKLLQSVGKADKIEHSEDYNEHNNLFKDSLTHFKQMERLGKRMIKSCEQVANDEHMIGETFGKYSETLHTHHRFNKEVSSEGLNSLSIMLASCGQAFSTLAALREGLQTNISVDYLQQVHECLEEGDVCKAVKDSYRECLMEQNVEYNKYKALKEKSTDLVKVKNQEVVHEKRVKISEQVQVMAMKEFAYQEELMQREYANSIRELVCAYRNYFLSGAEVLNNLERELLATTLPPAETGSRRAYNLRDIEQVMSKQSNNNDANGNKNALSRAEVLEKRRVFEVELSVVNKREHSYIPRIMSDLITYIEGHALEVEGIFRLAAGVPGLNILKKLYDGGKPVDLDRLILQREIDIHVVSCLLKLYLRELPTPLLTFELYEQFLMIANEEDEDTRNRELASLLQQLPHHNILLLDRLLQMLTRVAGNSNVNLMTSSNLAIVFGLNILKSQDNNPMRIAKDNASVNKVCELLIKAYAGKLNGTFMTLAAMAKQTRDFEIRQELDEEKMNQHNNTDEPEYRNTAPKVIAPENYLPPPSKVVTDNAMRKLPPQPSSTRPSLPSKSSLPPVPKRAAEQSGMPSPAQTNQGFNPRGVSGGRVVLPQPSSPRTTQPRQPSPRQHPESPYTNTQSIYPRMHNDNPYADSYEDDQRRLNNHQRYTSADDFF